MRRLSKILVVGGVAAVFIASVATIRAADVTETQVAQERLRQVGGSLQFYLYDNSDRLDDPIHLWEWGYLSDPKVFWHPGDSDPPPTTIDNSVPNAPNSARISFEFGTCTRPCDGFLPDEPIVWDNTPDNNGGDFIRYYTRDGAIEMVPPNLSPIPTSVAITRAHLKRLWWALHAFAMENGGIAPDQLVDVHPSPYAMSPRNFWNPGDQDPLPTDIICDEPDAVNSAQISFDFLVAGQNWDSIDPETVVLADNSTENNFGYGINEINRRGVVRFVAAGTLGDADNDGDIDLEDYAKMQQCITPQPLGAILDFSCRIMDWNGDDRVSKWDDHESFLGALMGPQPD